MNILLIVAIVAVVYFFIVFVVLRFITPFMGFRKPLLPEDVPEEIKKKVLDLKTVSFNKREYLEAAYDFVTTYWHAGRMDTVKYAVLAFRSNLKKIWNSPGYAHCNTQNYMLFILLVESKFFKPEDVTFHCVFFNFFIHQYLKVKIGNEWIVVDPGGASIRGMPLGKRIAWFG